MHNLKCDFQIYRGDCKIAFLNKYKKKREEERESHKEMSKIIKIIYSVLLALLYFFTLLAISKIILKPLF